MKIAVLDAATLGDDLSLAPLSGVGEVQAYAKTAPSEVAERIAPCEVVLINKVKLGAENLGAARNLKLICIAATGYDNVDVAFCREKGITVCNVAGYSTDSVAQVTVSTVLELATHLRVYAESVADGTYTAGGVQNRLTPVYHEIAGKTWGIAGCGHIGERVARIAEAFGCRVLVYRRKQAGPFRYVDLDTLCAESDILTVHVPLTAETRGMIGERELSLMKKEMILVNEARGAVLDEAAAAEAVLKGRIGGFGCDVYSEEPLPETHPYQKLRGLPNVCLTPHMAWGAREARERCLAEIVRNIRAFYAGEPRNVVS